MWDILWRVLDDVDTTQNYDAQIKVLEIFAAWELSPDLVFYRGWPSSAYSRLSMLKNECIVEIYRRPVELDSCRAARQFLLANEVENPPRTTLEEQRNGFGFGLGHGTCHT
jgi:hypothetical protein